MASPNNHSDSLAFAVKVLVALRPVQYVDIVLGVVISLASAISIMAIFMDTTLRRKNAYILVSVLCFGYLVHSVGIAAKGTFAVVLDSQHQSTMQTMRECCMEWTVLVLGGEIIIDVSFVIAVDRCIAVFFPVLYRRKEKWWWLTSQLLVIVIHIAVALFRQLSSTSDEPIHLCTILTAIDTHVMVIMMVEFNIIVALTIVLYIIVITWARQSIKKTANEGGNAAAQRKRLKWKLIVTMALNMIVYSMTMFVGNISFTTAAIIDDQEAIIPLLIFGEVDHFSGFFGLCVLFFRMNEFRRAIFRLFNRKVGPVQPSETSKADLSTKIN
uniref:G_PROTEIN_RECEP_F1_2 domain-containing protein n=1 Tax=Trichuris muris TaxID=70415 RepID=A0A5S6R0N5_TRIMR